MCVKLCSPNYEICRIRASILPIVSGVIFFGAVFSLVSSAGNPELVRIFTMGSSDQTLKGVVTDFHSHVYVPFVILFIMHLLRVYLSMLVIDEDPEFYYYNLKPLSIGERKCEYFLRSLILLTLLLLVKDHTLISEQLKWLPWLSKTYFAAALYIYLSLLLWDLFMLYSLGIKATKNSLTRCAYFLSDITGFLMAILIVMVECGGIKTTSLPSWSGVMYLLFAASLFWLILDLVWDKFSNFKKYRDHILMFRHYFSFPCTNSQSLTTPCPFKKKNLPITDGE